LGGSAVSDASYNRFFALHFLLPFVIAAMVAVHIWAFLFWGLTYTAHWLEILNAQYTFLIF
jgi:quinol-cytochrome oxidoreductase complex cytochrome b subunit